jgi:hypothetical protein
LRIQDKIVRERWFNGRREIGQTGPGLGIDYKVSA